ncbi:MAG: carbohydrate ABC transporter permease [Capsulimonadales bacterium]|nr:carbohydrate ABC transporter permease [Capsulimonadales bacterium]
MSRKPNPLGNMIVLVALLILCLGFALPFLWMMSTSLKTLDRTMAMPPQWVPDPIVPQNYVKVLQNPKLNFPLLTRNTLMVAVLSVLGTTLSSSLVAYGFARIRFKGNSTLFGLMLATMMIPFPVIMVPLFTVFRWLGDHTGVPLLGTLTPLWLPSWFGSAFNIFMLRQFFLTLPMELSEAAQLDGCSEFGIFRRIVLPLSRPALAVVALFTFMGAWNDFLGPLVYLQDPGQYTLALGLQTFQSQHGGTEWNLLMAASVLVISPVILLFFLAQRTFIQGIATTGMK